MSNLSSDKEISLSVFVSSPGDLPVVRKCAREIIQQMSGLCINGIKVIFKPMLYEDYTPAAVNYKPQQAVDYFMGRADEMDIYVGMFWSRMGSAVTINDRRIPSGTRYEFDVAYKGLRLTGRPQMLLYRCVLPPESGSDPHAYTEVDEFFGCFRGNYSQFSGFPHSFGDDQKFATLLKRDLVIIAKDIIRKKLALPSGKNGELAGLVSSVRTWLATFEDLFGNRIQENQERERDRLFRIKFSPLPSLAGSVNDDANATRPRKNESLLDLFDAWNGRVFMVGERGTGKTFSMLGLMQDMADRAFARIGDPVPVFFNLSSWNETHTKEPSSLPLFARVMDKIFPTAPSPVPSLDKWLEDQLVKNYSMQRKAARTLLGRNQAIICLDGLDELGAPLENDEAVHKKKSADLRDACVRAINETLANHAVKMVLCCREETFNELANKPQLGVPLKTQLLTKEDVFSDLENWPRLDGLRAAMSASEVLLERARIALFLGMMRVAYRDMNAGRILEAVALSELEWERHLLDHYVDQCMRLAPPESVELNKELIPRCLSWMARMPDNDFLIDDMQPSLLRTNSPEEEQTAWKTYRVFSVSVLALSLMVVETIPAGLSLGIAHAYHTGWPDAVAHCIVMWLLSAMLLTPLYLAAFSTGSWVVFGSCFGLAWALDSAVCIFLTILGWNKETDGIREGAQTMFLTSLPCACMFFMLMGMQFIGRIKEHRRRYSKRVGIDWHEILPIEPMNWCWFDKESYWRGGWIGLVVGPAIMGIALLGGEGARGLVACLVVGALVTMFSGLSGTGVAKVSIEPNQGMARSLRHSLFMTRVFVLGGGLCWGIIYTRNRDWIHGLAGLCMGLTLAFSFYVFGGWPVVRQYCLGTVLSR